MTGHELTTTNGRPPLAATRSSSSEVVSSGFGSGSGFELLQRVARALCTSSLVPETYRDRRQDKKTKEWMDNPGGFSNCIVALDMANRMGANPLMVMQNLYIVEGRPSWSSQFIIAAVNSCGRFSPLRFDLSEEGAEREVEYEFTSWEQGQDGKRRPVDKIGKVKIKDRTCRAWAVEKATGERLDGPLVSIEMAVTENWATKNGSKWQTMPEVMLRYRAASFFGKLYAPELLMGLQSAEEVAEIIDITTSADGRYLADAGRPALIGAHPQTDRQPEEDTREAGHDLETGEVTDQEPETGKPVASNPDPVVAQGERQPDQPAKKSAGLNFGEE